ncbi:MAG: enoyl-CoA hydratase/isomerase family protein [Planctomycetota bacterium]
MSLTWRELEGPLQGALALELGTHPLNELGEAALVELERFVADALPACRGVLVVSTLERGFCAGADLRGLAAGLAEDPEALTRVRAFLVRIGAVFRALDEAPVPVIGAVHGAVFGGGLELALCCDVLVADPSARFGFPELRLGLVPGFGGLTRLGRDVGQAWVRDLLLSGRSLSADAALRAGLITQRVAAGRQQAAAERLLAQALRHPPAATAAAKRLLKRPDPAALDREIDAFCELVQSPTVLAALRAFVARTDPLPYVAQERP